MANANPADKQAKLQNAMSRAKKLIQLESNGTLDKIAAGVRDGVNSSLESGDIITEQLMTTPRNRRTEAPMVGAKMGENAMNVPAAIRESFSTNPIDESSLYSAFGSAKGGNDDLAFLTEDIPTPRQPQRVNMQSQDVRQLVNEGMGYQQPKYGYIDEMTWLVKQKQHKKGYWTYENIEKEAVKYETKTDFQKNCNVAYRKALQLKIIDDFFTNDYIQY